MKAISLQPDNPATWQQLGVYDVQHGQPHKALGVLEHAQQLDLGSPQIAQSIAQAKAVLAAIKARTASRGNSAKMPPIDGSRRTHRTIVPLRPSKRYDRPQGRERRTIFTVLRSELAPQTAVPGLTPSSTELIGRA